MIYRPCGDHHRSAGPLPLWGTGPLAQCQGATLLKTSLNAAHRLSDVLQHGPHSELECSSESLTNGRVGFEAYPWHFSYLK